MIDTRHVAAARRGRVLRVEGEAEHVDVAIGDVGVVLVRLHRTEVGGGLRGEARLVVEVERRRDERVAPVDAGVVRPRVALLVARAADGPN